MSTRSPKGPLISNFQRFSVDDGPGIRTTVFFKGCNLNCLWCHNPENIPAGPVLQFAEKTCVQCGRCAAACQKDVHAIKETGHRLNRSLCIACGSCADACLSDALEIIGLPFTPDQVFSELKKDESFYAASGGGVTFSGGEPMLFAEYLVQILKKCRAAGIHTAVDTAGNVPYSRFDAVRRHADLFLFDVKCIDSERHRQGTGAGNERILENLKKLSGSGSRIIIRIPVIPGFNDRVDELGAAAARIAALPRSVELVQLLPYHAYGTGKYTGLGLDTPMKIQTPPSDSFMKEALSLFQNLNIPARIS